MTNSPLLLMEYGELMLLILETAVRAVIRQARFSLERISTRDLGPDRNAQ